MSTLHPPHPPVRGEPFWDIAQSFPAQGDWTEAAYLEISDRRLFEFCDGFIEMLPMPDEDHQDIVIFLLRALLAFVEPRDLGKVTCAPMPVKVREGKFREPDVLFMFRRNADRRAGTHWNGADLVIEVVSGGPKDRNRDLKEKRSDYARARIPEYWIVDPQEKAITVLRLRGRGYVVHGRFGAGERAASALLDGFAVDVGAVFERK